MRRRLRGYASGETPHPPARSNRGPRASRRGALQARALPAAAPGPLRGPHSGQGTRATFGRARAGRWHVHMQAAPPANIIQGKEPAPKRTSTPPKRTWEDAHGFAATAPLRFQAAFPFFNSGLVLALGADDSAYCFLLRISCWPLAFLTAELVRVFDVLPLRNSDAGRPIVLTGTSAFAARNRLE